MLESCLFEIIKVPELGAPKRESAKWGKEWSNAEARKYPVLFRLPFPFANLFFHQRL